MEIKKAAQINGESGGSVTGISPSTGSILGSGTNQVLTIHGQGFTGAKGVWFGGTALTSPQTFNVVNDNKITTCVPSTTTAGVVDVQVLLASDLPTSKISADQYTYWQPVVTSISPAKGPETGSGTNQVLTIKGHGFTGAKGVWFAGTAVVSPQTFTIINDNKITTCVPQGTGVADVQVLLASDLPTPKISADEYTYVCLPAITSLSTNTGLNAGGTLVTINGSGLTGATKVQFGNNEATIQATPAPTDTQITVLSPKGSGTVNVTVITPNGTSPLVSADQFMYSTIPFSLTIPDDVATMGIYLSMYGFLQQQYTNTLGTTIPAQTNVILINTSTGYDYIEAAGMSAGQMIPPFLFVNQTTTVINIDIPNVNIKAARIVIGVNSGSPVNLTSVGQASNNQKLPQATINAVSVEGFSTKGTLYICTNCGITQVNYTGTDTTNNTFTGCTGGVGTMLFGTIISNMPMVTPEVNDASGDVTAPTPSSQGDNIYDFFEFTYVPVSGEQTMTINTSAIDQFGLPIQLTVAGQSVQPGNEVGIVLKREDVINQFSAFTKGSPYNELIYPSIPANSVVRILSPSDQLGNNPVQGLTVSNTTTAQGSLSANTIYSYVVTAVINNKEVYAPALLAQTTPSSSGSIIVSWGVGADETTYNVYRGVPNGNNITWYQAIKNTSANTYIDKGPYNSGTVQNPTFDPLGNYFDAAIVDLFNCSYPIILSVTDGSSPANGLQYTFAGIAKPAPAWLNQATGTQGNQVIEFSCISITNNPKGINPLIPIGSLFYVFSPFFNTNTGNPDNPQPPVWNGVPMLFSNLFATAMAFGADGVFADNLQQSAALYASLANTTVAHGSDKSKLPQSTLQVTSTAGFQKSGVLYIRELNTLITYSGISGNSFTGCTGGGGTLATGMNVFGPLQLATVSGTQTLPSATISASGIDGYPTNGGTLYIWVNGSASPVPVSYTGINGKSFTGCTGGTGSIPDGSLIAVNNCQPSGLEQNAFSVAVGSLEDALNAAILRGVATTINSVNWANAPTNPAACAGPSTVTNTSTYYYVITTLNSSGESTPSEEVSYITNNTSIQLSWAPVNGASSYNIYRGASAGGENILIGNTSSTSFEDKLAVASLPQVTPPASGITTAPSGLVASVLSQTGGQLPANAYFYVVTALAYNGESPVSNEVTVQVSSGMNAVKLTWNNVANASAYKIYRGTATGEENTLVGIVQGGNTCSFTDGNNITQTPPPNIYYAPGTVSDTYAQFFHQTSVSIGGLAYADPYDDQGGQSSTLTAVSPQGVYVTLPKWSDS